MLHITSVSLLTILEPCTQRTDFQAYLGTVIAKKGADSRFFARFTKDFSPRFFSQLTGFFQLAISVVIPGKILAMYLMG